jgi:prepilin-type N-terminal cleavage/methylation domain-containing protein
MKLSTTRRGGFTLLEVLLASALAVVLMAALYVALDVQLRLAEAGRESIEEARVTRAIVQRFENDLSSVMGPVAPPTGKGQGQSGSASGSGATSGTGAATGTGSGATTGTGASTNMSGMTAVTDATQTTTIPFQAGVIGESDGDNRPRLVMFVSKVAGLGNPALESPDVASPPDVRRVVYWMTDWGLARQELPWVTAEQLQNSTDPLIEDGKEERDYVISEEVTKLAIEYWDGTTWQETWDGRTLNSDGVTLLGPPMAIRVRFTLNVPGPNPGETVEKVFQHTINVRSAAGPAVPDSTTQAQQQQQQNMGATSGSMQ